MIVENALFAAEVPEHGVTDGHVRFRLVRADAESVMITGLCANMIAGLLFERMQAQGSNIILSLAEGGKVDVIARHQDDGVSFAWQPLELSPEKMDEAQRRIGERLLAKAQPARPAPVAVASSRSEEDDDADDILVKQLRRIP